MSDDRIAQVLNRVRIAAMDELEFELDTSRGDGLLHLRDHRTRITFETRFIHGEGRIVLGVTRQAGGKSQRIHQRQREILVRGLGTVNDETETVRRALVSIVNRAMK